MMKTLQRTILYLAAAAIVTLASGCNGGDTPIVSLGLDDYYRVARMTKLDLDPALTGQDYRWTITRPDGTDSIIEGQRRLVFLTAEEGRYTLRFDIVDPSVPVSHEMTVDVLHEEVEFSPYIATVTEYCPAPDNLSTICRATTKATPPRTWRVRPASASAAPTT